MVDPHQLRTIVAHEKMRSFTREIDRKRVFEVICGGEGCRQDEEGAEVQLQIPPTYSEELLGLGTSPGNSQSGD